MSDINSLPVATLAQLADPEHALNGLGTHRSRWNQIALVNVGGMVYYSSCLGSSWVAAGPGKQLLPKENLGPLVVIPGVPPVEGEEPSGEFSIFDAGAVFALTGSTDTRLDGDYYALPTPGYVNSSGMQFNIGSDRMFVQQELDSALLLSVSNAIDSGFDGDYENMGQGSLDGGTVAGDDLLWNTSTSTRHWFRSTSNAVRIVAYSEQDAAWYMIDRNGFFDPPADDSALSIWASEVIGSSSEVRDGFNVPEEAANIAILGGWPIVYSDEDNGTGMFFVGLSKSNPELWDESLVSTPIIGSTEMVNWSAIDAFTDLGDGTYGPGSNDSITYY